MTTEAKWACIEQQQKWQYVEMQLKMLQSCNETYEKALQFMDVNSPLMNAIFEVEENFLETLEYYLGINDNWLRWFVYDNDFGKNGLLVENGDDLKPIKTLSDLREVLVQ